MLSLIPSDYTTSMVMVSVLLSLVVLAIVAVLRNCCHQKRSRDKGENGGEYGEEKYIG